MVSLFQWRRKRGLLGPGRGNKPTGKFEKAGKVRSPKSVKGTKSKKLKTSKSKKSATKRLKKAA